jgi:hypothetical protein
VLLCRSCGFVPFRRVISVVTVVREEMSYQGVNILHGQHEWQIWTYRRAIKTKDAFAGSFIQANRSETCLASTPFARRDQSETCLSSGFLEVDTSKTLWICEWAFEVRGYESIWTWTREIGCTVDLYFS